MSTVRSWESDSDRWTRLALLVVILFLTLLLAARTLRNVLTPSYTPRVVAARGDLASDEKTAVEIFDANAPAVVYVTTQGVRRDFLSREVSKVPTGSGSGFLWDEAGHVVTNFHVIASLSLGGSCEVTLHDGSTWRAIVHGLAPDYDLAVLKINAPPARLRRIELGSSKDLRVGQKVFAIGNPLGYDHTMTSGIVSALHREIRSMSGTVIQDVVQTDAAINPGNSGGPLLDSAGRLIGVNTAIRGDAQNIGFSIPADTVRWVVDELIRLGHVERPVLGVHLLSELGARQIGIEEGVVVIGVAPGSPAEEAGLRSASTMPNGDIVFDVLLSLDGVAINNTDDVHRVLSRKKVGEKVALTFLRDERMIEATATLRSGEK